MRRIGILGGAFNPVHIGHLVVADVVAEQLKLDKVIFVPCNLPPHKSGKGIISSRHRYNMVCLATAGNKKFEVSDFEINRDGKSYSIDTVIYFSRRFPRGTKIYFIIGEDNLATLYTWKRIDDLLKIVSFVSVNRSGGCGHQAIKVRPVATPNLEISSSDVRRRIVAGKTVKYLLTENVIEYIKKQKLYLPAKR